MALPQKNTYKQHLQNSACSSQDHNRSTVKRMYSSVFSMIDNDQDVSHFSELDQQSRIQLLLSNRQLVDKLQEKMRSEGVVEGYNLPVLRISLYTQSNYSMHSIKAELDQKDIQAAMRRFGEISQVAITLDKTDAYVFFNSLVHTYICYKLINQATLRGGAEMRAEWVNHHAYHPQIANQLHSFINSMCYPTINNNSDQQNGHPNKQNKFTCRYDIQIQNEKQFQVARRIIGSKGCNMKRIIEESIYNDSKTCSNDSVNELLKLRLRGKGSGYKQGPQQQQSSQNLHLCVSSKDENVYTQACEKVQKLLTAIYSQYFEFTRKQGRATELMVKKILIGQSPSAVDENSSQGKQVESYYGQIQGDIYRIGSQKIEELLQMRNKARRQLNFSEADRIRNYLRSCGVCLIDEKGRRGRATEVTTWKYLY